VRGARGSDSGGGGDRRGFVRVGDEQKTKMGKKGKKGRRGEGFKESQSTAGRRELEVRRTGESKSRHMYTRVDAKDDVLNLECQFLASVDSENAVRLRWVTIHHSNLRQGVVGAGFEVEAAAVVADCEWEGGSVRTFDEKGEGGGNVLLDESEGRQ
jgi:hypothetical protein